MFKIKNINSLDCVNPAFIGADYSPHMTGFIFNIMKEVWKQIKEAPNYLVSNLGKVKSFATGNILKQKLNNPYPAIYLRAITGKRKLFRIHRLVALNFIPNPQNKRTVNHIDGIKTNNNVHNLEWATYSENHFHAYKNGLKTPPNEKAVLQMTVYGEIVKEFKSTMEAQRETKVWNTVISACCLGKKNHKTGGGFIWKYKH